MEKNTAELRGAECTNTGKGMFKSFVCSKSENFPMAHFSKIYSSNSKYNIK